MIEVIKSKFNWGRDSLIDCSVTICVFLIPTIYASLISLYGAPVTEGWFTYYARLLSQGRLPYKDFDFLLPPAYLFLLYILIKMFGIKYYALRVVGVIVFGMTSVVLYKTLRQCFGIAASCFGAICAVFYMQSEVAQFFYDYTRVMDLISVVTLFFFIKCITSKKDLDNWAAPFFCGFFASLFLLTKQNMGGCIVAFIFLWTIILSAFRIIDLRRVLYMVMGGGLPLALLSLYLFFSDSFVEFYDCITHSATEAKGGLSGILSRGLFGILPTFKAYFPILIKGFVLIMIILVIRRLLKHTSENTIIELLFAVAFCIGILILLLLTRKKEGYASFLCRQYTIAPDLIFWIVLCVELFIVIYGFLKKNNVNTSYWIFLTIINYYLVISWGCTMSGGLVRGQAYLGVAFLIGGLMNLFSFKYGEYMKMGILVLGVIFCGQSASIKYMDLYAWWYVDVGSIYENTSEVDIPLLQGLKMSAADADLYRGLYESIYSEYSHNGMNEDMSIVCFPSIPIIYNMLETVDPGLRAPIQWFDFSNEESLRSDMDFISDSLPSIIVILEYPEEVYSLHEQVFYNGVTSTTTKMRDFLHGIINEKDYDLICSRTFSDNNTIFVYSLRREGL